ncbi:MAG: cyclase family protein [Oscillospiraceae bacterium]|nr:cyclase family protein [Oscillospiraceae bacterium]
MKIVDISKDLATCDVYPGDPETQIVKINDMSNGDEYNLSILGTCLHTGTHIDAPSHVFDSDESPKSLNDYSLDKFIGPVRVITLPEGPITGEIVENYFPKFDKKVILRMKENTFFFVGAAEDVGEIKYDLLGFNKAAIGGKNEMEVHRAILGSGTLLLENLDLSNVEDGEYFLLAQPLKISGVEAAPVRALLIDERK